MAAVGDLAVLAMVLRVSIMDFVWTHPWWQTALVAVAAISLPVLAYLEWRDSEAASKFRTEAEQLRGEIHELQKRLFHELLKNIDENTKRQISRAERNAAILRSHFGEKVSVSEGHRSWSDPAEIVEVTDDHILTLFTPHGARTSTAFSVRVGCNDLQITEVPGGSPRLHIKVSKHYEKDIQHGTATRWQDRNQPPVAIVFAKGTNVRSATFGQPGKSEIRTINIYQAKDGNNSFLLEARPGGSFTGDNVTISKQFVLLQVEYEAEGFTLLTSSSGGGTHRLYIKNGG